MRDFLTLHLDTNKSKGTACSKKGYAYRWIWETIQEVRVITVFTVFRLLTDYVCLYTYEFWLSLCKIVRSSVMLLLPLLVHLGLLGGLVLLDLQLWLPFWYLQVLLTVKELFVVRQYMNMRYYPRLHLDTN